MELSEYQRQAIDSDQCRDETSGEAPLVPLIGLAGEVGSLLSAYKRRAREGLANEKSSECITEELGDVLWYLSNLATRAGLSLDEIATGNLAKVRSRWLDCSTAPRFFDDSFP